MNYFHDRCVLYNVKTITLLSEFTNIEKWSGDTRLTNWSQTGTAQQQCSVATS